MARKNLSDVARMALSEHIANHRPADNDAPGEPIGAGKGGVAGRGVPPGGNEEDLGGSPVDPKDNGIAHAVALAPRAKFPGKAPTVGDAPYRNIRQGSGMTSPVHAADDGTVSEEPGHGKFESDPTHKLATLGGHPDQNNDAPSGISEEDLDEEDLDEEDLEEEDDDADKKDVSEEPALNKELQIKPMVTQTSVSDRVKGYVKGKKSIAGFSVESDIKALFQGEKLSENFMKKAKVIFETSLIERSIAICEEIENELIEQFDTAIVSIQEDLTNKVDDYLNYMVEEWVKENEIAIEKGIRAELAEDFIAGLRNLFMEHYIDIPEDKVNVVEELATKVEELEAQVNEEVGRAVELNTQLNEYKRWDVLRSVCEGLTETQAQKFIALTESVDFANEEDYTESLTTLRESYFPEKTVADTKAPSQQLDEESVEGDPRGVQEEETLDPEFAQYVNTISRTVKK